MTTAISPEARELSAILAAGMARMDRERMAVAAARAASGLHEGDRVTINGGGYHGYNAKITGVNRQTGAWELLTDSGITLARDSAGLVPAVAVEA